MISFDQVLLLEERVESAVKKIEQLNAENAALRAKVAELSNALNAKSEQFSSFQSDQSKIEEGILKALSRLNAVENVVLQASGAAQSVSVSSEHIANEQARSESVTSTQTQPVAEPVQVVQGNVPEPKEPVAQAQPQNTNQAQSVPVQNAEPSFDSMNVSEPIPEQKSQSLEPVQPIPEEIEVPVSQGGQTQPEPMSQNSQVPSVSESISSEIGFEFGDSDSSSQGNSQPAQDSQGAPSQPMFDIF